MTSIQITAATIVELPAWIQAHVDNVDGRRIRLRRTIEDRLAVGLSFSFGICTDGGIYDIVVGVGPTSPPRPPAPRPSHESDAIQEARALVESATIRLEVAVTANDTEATAEAERDLARAQLLLQLRQTLGSRRSTAPLTPTVPKESDAVVAARAAVLEWQLTLGDAIALNDSVSIAAAEAALTNAKRQLETALALAS